MASVKNKVSKYHLQPEDLRAHLQTLFPGEKIRIVDCDPDNRDGYFEVKLSKRLTEEQLQHIRQNVAESPHENPAESW